MKQRYSFVLLLLFFHVSWINCDHSTEPFPPDYSNLIPIQTDDGWITASLEDVGMEPDSLISLLNLISDTDEHLIHSILIIRNNRLVFEIYYNGRDIPMSGMLDPADKIFDHQTLHYQASVSKSVTSVLLGIAIDNGLISTVENSLFSFFPEYQDLINAENSNITLANLLAMCSGFDWNEFVYEFSDPRDSHYMLFNNDDPLAYLLGRAMISTPGSEFHYNSGDTNLLGEVVRRTTYSDYLSDFAELHLFGPLGIDSYHWNRLPFADHITFASGGLFLRPRDMAKIGQLYLNEGVWNGQRIVSAEWVRASTEMSIPFTEDYRTLYGYGYQWWLGRFPNGIEYYRATGWGGQYIYVMPEVEMVVVHTAGGYYDSRPIYSTTIIEEYVLTAIIE